MLARAGASLGISWAQRTAALCSTSYSTAANAASATLSEEQRQGIVKKLLYRSKQRGFLELDLIVGLWAESNIPKMQPEELRHMASLLDEENPDLFKWLTGQLEAPEHMTGNPVFKAIQGHVAQQLNDVAPDATRAALGRTWVRGWEDGWKKPEAKSGDAK
ncbi:hypothetical protein HYH03_016038 [Edaphochlamys debaryana]|uniref:Succinate dehydrogenase assembly factor 2, mitochondrial n=1 Tax=Edaphochlamys debaryana TaxID=47281 RepID=A0A835XID4_9CHLO|nr:hypothetical protein HYH03_016038 [Edaphochlamys debaryana]|eukprot:KAG2485252.1 hypothetical protein HYH03_016038 [Edaphochlamys debaryana]